MEEIVQLGEVTCPSGQLVIMDGGYLSLWSGERSPALTDPSLLGASDEEMAESIRAAIDFEIAGPDAVQTARAFARQVGLTCYDIPRHGVDGFVAGFDALCRERGFDARMVPFAARVPHRERVRRAIRSGDGTFLISGVEVVVVGGIPRDRRLAVQALPADDQTDLGWWRAMRVVVSDRPVATSQQIGTVAVDWARIAFADADALNEWEHEKAIDGLADIVFWGRDVEQAAAKFGAHGEIEPGSPGSRGWLDLPVKQALHTGLAIDEWSRESDRKLVVDFRPHSHHWQVMREVRATEYEAGQVTVAGASILFAMTSRGDGFFPAYADRDDAGELVAIRVDLSRHHLGG